METKDRWLEFGILDFGSSIFCHASVSDRFTTEARRTQRKIRLGSFFVRSSGFTPNSERCHPIRSLCSSCLCDEGFRIKRSARVSETTRLGFWEEGCAGWQTGARTPPLLGATPLRPQPRGRGEPRTTNAEPRKGCCAAAKRPPNYELQTWRLQRHAALPWQEVVLA